MMSRALRGASGRSFLRTRNDVLDLFGSRCSKSTANLLRSRSTTQSSAVITSLRCFSLMTDSHFPQNASITRSHDVTTKRTTKTHFFTNGCTIDKRRIRFQQEQRKFSTKDSSSPNTATTTTTTGLQDDDAADGKKQLSTVDEEALIKETPADEYEDWIPPNRPLVGDIGQSFLHSSGGEQNMEDDDEEDDEDIEFLETDDDDLVNELLLSDDDEVSLTDVDTVGGTGADTAGPDWLKTRRAKLGEIGELMTPSEGHEKKRSMVNDSITVKELTLLTGDEITNFLGALGARDLVIIRDNPLQRRMPAAEGMIFCTVDTFPMARLMMESLVKQMRLRNLHKANIVGAKLGAEGLEDNDPFSDEIWVVVDCGSFVVHAMDTITRDTLKLEDIWTGKDRAFLELNEEDDDAVDQWMAENPIPESYGRRRSAADWDANMKQLEKTRYTTGRRAPIGPKPKRKRKSRR